MENKLIKIELFKKKKNNNLSLIIFSILVLLFSTSFHPNNVFNIENETEEYQYVTYLPIIFKSGNSIYVSTNGSDSNPGTFSQPYKTISMAVKSLEPGDTVIIRGGIYKEAVNIRSSGTKLLPINIIAYQNETPIIDGYNQLPTNYSGLVSIYGDWVRVSGLEVRNSKYSGMALYGKYNIADDIFVHHSQKSGLYLSGDYGIIENSRIWRNSLQSEYGKSTSVSSGLVAGRDQSDGLTEYAILRNNISWENWGQGIDTYESNGTIMEGNISHDNYITNIYISDSTNVLCQRNFVYMNPNSYVYNYGSNVGIMIGDEVYKPLSANITVINNIAYGNRINFALWKGIESRSINNILIANNTFINSIETTGVILKGYHQNVRFQNNIVHQDNSIRLIMIELDPDLSFSNNLWNKTPPPEASGTGDVIGDPLLNKTDNPFSPEWYKLSNLSPAINKALSLSQVTDDFFQQLREIKPDIGADELGL